MNIRKLEYVKNKKYSAIGLILVILNYIRHIMFGYKTPRTFSNNQKVRAIDYDFSVVNNWINHLKNYRKEENYLKNKVILELGPGPDLGIGLILLAMGVRKYIAFDTHQLINPNNLEFYSELLGKLKKIYADIDTDKLKEEVVRCLEGKSQRMCYKIDKNFDITKIEDKIDIVFSHAAFEHFEDMEKTISLLSKIISKDGILIALIDLSTHTRWIRGRDPLNIYRYGDLFWNLFKFKGSPNRVRTSEYKKLLENNGWTNIEIEPLTVLEEQYVEKVLPSLNIKYRILGISEMRMLSVMLKATRNSNNVR